MLLDSGALIAYERNDRDLLTRLERAFDRGVAVRSSAIVVAQVWRDSRGRQARLARLLASIEVRPVDEVLARRAGVILGRAGTEDAVDAVLVAMTETGDAIITSDPGDIARLVAAAGIDARVVRS